MNSHLTNCPQRMTYFIFVIVLLLSLNTSYAQNSSEMAKIEYLIGSVNELKGAKFIRNGTEYDTEAASSHLRLKLKSAGNKIKTAEDFIQYCASKSSISGEPYLIRLADGSTLKSEVFFKNKLKEFLQVNNHK